MKTPNDIRKLAGAIILAVKNDELVSTYFNQVRGLFGGSRLSRVKPSERDAVYAALEKFARLNCPQIFYEELSDLARALAEIDFLRARWRLRMDEDAPPFIPEQHEKQDPHPPQQ